MTLGTDQEPSRFLVRLARDRKLRLCGERSVSGLDAWGGSPPR